MYQDEIVQLKKVLKVLDKDFERVAPRSCEVMSERANLLSEARSSLFDALRTLRQIRHLQEIGALDKSK